MCKAARMQATKRVARTLPEHEDVLGAQVRENLERGASERHEHKALSCRACQQFEMREPGYMIAGKRIAQRRGAAVLGLVERLEHKLRAAAKTPRYRAALVQWPVNVNAVEVEFGRRRQ
jgi:hypothetical protein